MYFVCLCLSVCNSQGELRGQNWNLLFTSQPFCFFPLRDFYLLNYSCIMYMFLFQRWTFKINPMCLKNFQCLKKQIDSKKVPFSYMLKEEKEKYWTNFKHVKLFILNYPLKNSLKKRIKDWDRERKKGYREGRERIVLFVSNLIILLTIFLLKQFL